MKAGGAENVQAAKELEVWVAVLPRRTRESAGLGAMDDGVADRGSAVVVVGFAHHGGGFAGRVLGGPQTLRAGDSDSIWGICHCRQQIKIVSGRY